MKSDCLFAKIAGLALFALLPAAGLSAETEAAPPPPAIECNRHDHTLFLAQGNVILRNLRWRVPSTGQTGCGTAVPHLQDTGHFWFFDSQNLELTCKVIDGYAVNQKYWVFCGALTNVEWWVEVRNNANSELPGKSYYNPPGQMASFADVSAVGHGANNSPYFVLAKTECGHVQPAAVGSFLMQVRDPDGDVLDAQVRVLEGDSTAVQITTVWQGPITQNTETGVYLWFDVRVPSTPGTYVLALEVADGKSLLPAQCIATMRVP